MSVVSQQKATWWDSSLSCSLLHSALLETGKLLLTHYEALWIHLQQCTLGKCTLPTDFFRLILISLPAHACPINGDMTPVRDRKTTTFSYPHTQGELNSDSPNHRAVWGVLKSNINSKQRVWPHSEPLLRTQAHPKGSNAGLAAHSAGSGSQPRARSCSAPLLHSLWPSGWPWLHKQFPAQTLLWETLLTAAAPGEATQGWGFELLELHYLTPHPCAEQGRSKRLEWLTSALCGWNFICQSPVQAKAL